MKLKNIIVLLVIPVLLMLLCSFKETDNFFRYEIINENEVHIIAFVGENFSSNIEIPEEIEGYKVTCIKEGAFYNNPHIKKIVIPSSVEVIENSAFAYCSSLENVVFNDGNSEILISQFAFEMCTALKSITFSNRQTVIDDYAFENCKMLGKLYFPESISYIGYLAFNGCESVIFDCENSTVAQKYAEENNIPTNFFMSDDFLIVMIVSSSLIIFIIMFIIYKFRQKNKKHKNK